MKEGQVSGSVARRSQPRPSELYPILWRFAVERHLIYLRRLSGKATPWTDDWVLSTYRFTNAFRAADRVSQYLIQLAYAEDEVDRETLFLRTVLFKIFNRIDTWDEIVAKLGLPVASRFDYAACEELLANRSSKHPIYSAAYIMPSGGRTGIPKHCMHLRLIRDMIAEGLPAKLVRTRSLQEVYGLLVEWPTLGPFLAFQYAIDFNYTSLTSHAEQDYVVPGPGALDGLAKCFESLGEFTAAETIMWLTDRQNEEFERYGLSFSGLWGRPLQPIDVQNLLCEVSKYTRATHPAVMGRSRRVRIKQRFTAAGGLPRPFFPPKWGLNRRIDDWFRAHGAKSGWRHGDQATLPFGDSDSARRSRDHD